MIRWERKSKVGRNEPCPCGSGQKFKKCHGRERHTNFSTPRILQDLQAFEIRERQRVKQQGLGRPIISAPIGGTRAIAVGDHLYRTKAKTFQEFLWEYMKSIFGSEWGNAELEKPADKRHPLLNWYQEAAKYINAHIVERGKV
jgi:hypothetical protein